VTLSESPGGSRRGAPCYLGVDGSAVILSDLACVFVVWPLLFWLSGALVTLAESWVPVAAGVLAASSSAAITMSLFDKGGWVSSGVSFGLTIPSERATAARSIIEFVSPHLPSKDQR
jgi:hypothetical protein